MKGWHFTNCFWLILSFLPNRWWEKWERAKAALASNLVVNSKVCAAVSSILCTLVSCVAASWMFYCRWWRLLSCPGHFIAEGLKWGHFTLCLFFAIWSSLFTSQDRIKMSLNCTSTVFFFFLRLQMFSLHNEKEIVLISISRKTWWQHNPPGVFFSFFLIIERVSTIGTEAQN